MKHYTLSILLLSALSTFAETPKQMAYSEVLQDIACSKFGAQKTNLGFPPKPADGKTATTVTDTWEYSNLTISLSVRGIKHGDGQLSYSVVLSAALHDGQ